MDWITRAAKGLLSEGDLSSLAEQGRRAELEEIAAVMKSQGMLTFEYYMAAYEAAFESGDREDLIAILESMMKASYHKRYMVELAALYCGRGQEGVPLSRRTCMRLQKHFKEGPEVEDASVILKRLAAGGVEKIFEEYRDYALRRGTVTPVNEEDPAEPVAAERPIHKPKPEPKKEIELPPEIAEAFEGLVGLREVKAQLLAFYRMRDFEKKRQELLNLPATEGKGHHFILYGNPGTGKTTVARILVKILHSLGICKEEKLVETDRGGLCGMYIGETAPKTTGVLESAKGGVLFIDEAYTLYKKDNPKDVGPEAVDTILKYMEDNRGDITIILAGYEEPMREMLSHMNPGFESRFNHHITLPDYTEDELLQIAENIAKKQYYVLAEESKSAFKKRMEREKVGEQFGNARTVRAVIEEASAKLAQRIMETGFSDELDMMILQPEDFGVDDLESESLDVLLEELNSLTGLGGVKAQIHSMVKTLKAQQIDEENGIARSNKSTMHMAFLGNPGTGKTTVARLLGRIYRSLGILKRGDVFVECTRGDLVGQHSGETAIKTKDVVKSALGGILFIDEAYSLYSGDNDAFGLEAINTLIAEMENNRENLLVILAGYTQEMMDFFSVNPGMKSRVPVQITFDDYSPEELTIIYENSIKKSGFRLPEGWKPTVQKLIASKQAADGKEFANARGVRNMVEAALRRRNVRVAEASEAGTFFTEEELRSLTLEDITEQDTGAESIEKLLEELNSLTGLEEVKLQVNSIVKSLKARAIDKEMGISRNDSMGTLHMVFSGNPGTGKTTVARLLGRIYRTLGILKRGHIFKEVSRAELVAGYQGQTAAKVRELVKDCTGGILFVDEAYSLYSGSNDSFGKEAVDTLMAEMENRRDDLMVIFAGYEDEMREFLKTNPGLQSRVPTTLHFVDYNAEELMKIFAANLKQRGFRLEEGWEEIVKPALERELQKDGRAFANARGARNFCQKAMSYRDSRIADAYDAGVSLTREDMTLIKLEDLRF